MTSPDPASEADGDVGHPADAEAAPADPSARRRRRRGPAAPVGERAPGPRRGEAGAPAVQPPVLAVVVAHDPGAWFEETLASLGAQTYENLSVLVVDSASREPVAPRVEAVLPGAHVRRLEVDRGFGAACNEALGSVEGAAFHLLCHDDVRLEPPVVRLLVEEAFRSNAGVVGPKLVRWDDPDRLLAVGMGADRLGQPVSLVEPGELDQSQHEAVREVFYVPGAVTLVRADLFAALGGFDDGIDLHGDDLDLCWRARVAGARVVVAPAARVAHLEALALRHPRDDRRRLQMRHRLRATLVSSARATRLRVLPLGFLLGLVEALYALTTGRFHHAGDVAGAWWWNLRRTGEVRRRRSRVSSMRTVSDAELRSVQAGGSARVGAYLRGRIGRSEDRVGLLAGRARVRGALGSSSVRSSLVAWGAVLAVLALGSRHLLTDGVPAVGDFVPFPGRTGDLFAAWTTGYRDIGLGVEAPAPPGLAFFGVVSVLSGGSTGLARTLLVLGALPLGAAGAWRLVRPVGSRRARIAALLVFVANPLTYNAVARGRWGALVLAALAPWIVLQLAQATRVAPYGDVGGPAGPGVAGRSLVRHVLALGLLTAVLGMWLPAAPLIVVAMAVTMALGALLVGQVAGALRSAAVAVGAGVVAVVLGAPWSPLLLADPGDAWWGASLGDSPALDLGALLRFETGPIGASLLGWSLLVGSSLALLIGREWRLAWAARGWALAVASWSAVYVTEQGWLPATWPVPVTEVLLAPAVAGLALAAAMGMAAFEVDLPDYHFGWRQVASVVAAAGVVVAFLPVLASAAGGRWDLPDRDLTERVAFAGEDAAAAEGAARLLWVGDPDLVPVAGWSLDAPEARTDRQRLVYGTSAASGPGVEALWLAAPPEGTVLLGDALRTAAAGGTNRLGSLLAPMGVRYVVVPERLAPGSADPADGSPEVLVDVLARQLDLAPVPVGEGVVVFRNEAWVPARAAVPEGATLPGEPVVGRVEPLEDAVAVLPGDELEPEPGPVPGPGELHLAYEDAAGWELRVDGAPAARREALGWSTAFAVGAPGQGELSYRTTVGERALVVAPVLAWAAAIAYLIRARTARERRRALAGLPPAEPTGGDPLPTATVPNSASVPTDASSDREVPS